jgi:DNA polymerase I
VIAFDCETTGLDPRKCKPTHIGLYDTEHSFRMYNIDQIINAPFINKSPELIMHNGKFDTLMMWWNHKVWLPWKYDTMLLSQLYDSRVKHKLDNLGELYLGRGKWGEKKVLAAIKKGEFWMLPYDVQSQYLRRDCELTYDLYQFFRQNLSANLWKLYDTFDLPVSLALAKVEQNGFQINEELLNEYKRDLEVKFDRISLELQSRYGSINFNSPIQLLSALKSRHNIELQNTSERSLGIIAKHFPELNTVLEFRELSKYLNTYIGGITKHLYKGKIYPQYHLAGDYHTSTGRSTETGRTSSSNPNLQNQPRSGNGPVNIRQLFKASEGNVLMAFDYNQLELKVGAYLAGEKNLLEGDIHQKAADILGVERNVGKTCNFALLYGAGRPKIFYTSGGSKNVDKYLKWFKDNFPKAVKWCQDVQQNCKESGQVQTYLGRKRYMDNFEAGSNTIIQGSSGDLGKAAVYKIHEAGYKVVGFIHDEIILDVDEREVHNTAIEVQRIMTKDLYKHEDICSTVGLGVSIKTGHNWGKMKEYEYGKS